MPTLPPEIQQVQGVTVICLGEDYANLYESLLENLSIATQLAQTITPPRMVMDLRNVKFVGSAFLGFAVSLHKILSAREGGRFALCELSPFCRTALTLSRLETVLDLFDDLEAATFALKPK